MTYRDAQSLRRTIIAEGIHATVPRGGAPDHYVARILTARGQPDRCVVARDFPSVAEWETWYAEVSSERDRETMMRILASEWRSSIAILIDRACGLA